MSVSSQPWIFDGRTLRLFVRLTPRAGRDMIVGIGRDGDGRAHIVAKVRAVPEKGEANAALERLVAGWLGIGRTQVRLAGGATARLKILEVLDASPQTIARLEALLAAAAGRD